LRNKLYFSFLFFLFLFFLQTTFCTFSPFFPGINNIGCMFSGWWQDSQTGDFSIRSRKIYRRKKRNVLISIWYIIE
jgi:hypothetical protein